MALGPVRPQRGHGIDAVKCLNGGFLIQGEDRTGAVAEVVKRLAEADVNVTSVQVFCAGSGRYGGMLWVKAPDLRKAAKALGIA